MSIINNLLLAVFAISIGVADARADGIFNPGGGGSLIVDTTPIVGGTDKRVLFDDNGVVGEDAGLVFDKATSTLTIGIGTFQYNAGNMYFGGVTNFGDGTTVGIGTASNGGSIGGIALSSERGINWSSNGVWYGTKDLILQRGGAGILEQRNGTNAQMFSLYNTYTDASNYERAVFDWQTVANTLTIGTQNAGTGLARNIQIVIGGVPKLDYGISTAGIWTFKSGISINNENTITSSYTIAYFSGYGVGTTPTTVATLTSFPSNMGARAYVTDATSGTFGDIAVGGGTNKVPVYFNGTNWIIG